MSGAKIAIYATFSSMVIVTALFCYMIYTIDNVQFKSNKTRGRLLAAQIMLLHSGAQPPPNIRRGRVPARVDRRFSKAARDIPQYQEMLRKVFKLVTGVEWASISTRIDDLIDDRNGFAHPLNEDYIIEEAEDIVYALNVFWRLYRLRAVDRTAMDILSKCSEILSAPRPPP